MQSQGSITNLINRYRAVLRKCRLLNIFGTLAVVGVMVLGAAQGAAAVDYYGTLGGPGATTKPDYSTGMYKAVVTSGTYNNVYGVYKHDTSSNTVYGAVDVSGGTFHHYPANIYGGYAYCIDVSGSQTKAEASGNTVTISGGTFGGADVDPFIDIRTNMVCGGYAEAYSYSSQATPSAEAKGNTVKNLTPFWSRV